MGAALGHKESTVGIPTMTLVCHPQLSEYSIDIKSERRIHGQIEDQSRWRGGRERSAPAELLPACSLSGPAAADFGGKFRLKPFFRHDLFRRSLVIKSAKDLVVIGRIERGKEA